MMNFSPEAESLFDTPSLAEKVNIKCDYLGNSLDAEES